MSGVSSLQTEANALRLVQGVPNSWAAKAGSAEAVKCRFYSNDVDEEDGIFRPGQDSVMVAAALTSRFLTDITRNNPGSAFAVAGGVAFKALNNDSRRATFDVDVAFRGNVNTLLLAILTRPPIAQLGLTYNRFVLPSSVVKAVASTLRMYLKVGPTYGDRALRSDNLIQVDIMTSGGPSAAGGLGFLTNSTDISVVLHDQQLSIHCVNVLCLMDSKLKSFESRYARKDWDDIVNLLRNHGPTISQARDRFNQTSRRVFLTQPPPGAQVLKQYVNILYGRTPSPDSD